MKTKKEWCDLMSVTLNSVSKVKAVNITAAYVSQRTKFYNR